MGKSPQGDLGYDPIFLRPMFQGIFGLFGAIATGISLLQTNWTVAVVAGVVTILLIGGPWLLRWHRRQIASRVNLILQQKNRAFSQFRANTIAAVDALHLFIHTCRDSVIELKNRYAAISTHAADERERVQEAQDIAKRFFEDVLERMIDVFRPLVPSVVEGCPVNLWTAMREVRKINGKNCYVTFVRRGAHNPDRDISSEAVPEDMGLPKALRQAYKNGTGILIIPAEKPNMLWTSMRNDARKEDLSIMAAPIILKTTDPWQMAMILYLNSPTAGVLDDSLKPYIKCCADLLSTVLNALIEILEIRMNPPVESE